MTHHRTAGMVHTVQGAICHARLPSTTGSLAPLLADRRLLIT